MPAGNYNLYIEKGADFSRSFAMSRDSLPVDLTGYSGLAAMSRAYKATPVSFTVEISETPEDGVFSISLSAEDSLAVAYVSGVWDLLLIDPDGLKQRLLSGTVQLSPNVA